MSDTRPYWSAEELFPKVDEMAKILRRDNRICLVALTGSLARLGETVHDIDLVALHDGRLPIGTVKIPAVFENENIFSPAKFFAQDIIDGLQKTRGVTPVDIIFVPVSALWSCHSLQGLKPFEYFRDFYLRILCDPNLPLLLLGLSNEGNKEAYVAGPTKIEHRCDDPRCKPTLSWKDSQEEVLARKAAGTHSPS